jgi:hypothetical protein
VCGNSGDVFTVIEIRSNRRKRRTLHFITNNYIVAKTGMSSGDDIIAQFHTACNSDLGAQKTTFTHLHVVGYLDEIVDFRSRPDNCGPELRSVYTTAGSNLDFVFDNHVAYVRYLLMDSFNGIVSESVGPDNAVWPYDHPIPYYAPVENHDTLLKRAFRTDGDVSCDTNISV